MIDVEGFDAFQDAFGWLGFVGGCMFPIATGAQVYKVLVTKSARDISYGWEAMYIIAETLYVIYGVHFRLWPLVIPNGLDLAIMTLLCISKVYFDYFGSKSNRTISTLATPAPDLTTQPRVGEQTPESPAEDKQSDTMV
eukprot:TRINITY_DN7586_c0_g1_i1.p1 TRINITY_DN7586_c0_g1~~TRINITY_DN7586_c0_g1_i1.p1  ORF type:complete len:139 (+),score=13.69 TRINITY_DN7586_c0_g1_i1:211-627(+)